MFEKIVNVYNKLILSNNPRGFVNYLLSLLLFTEFVILGTSSFFPIYDIFIYFYPSGLPQSTPYIIEIIFYISFFLATTYTLILGFLFVADCILDILKKYYDNSTDTPSLLYSTKNKLLKISKGCQANLFITNNILLIIIIPLAILNETVLINCVNSHPMLCLLIGSITILIIPTTLSSIVKHFFTY